jgi:hypothetical protein
LNIIGNLDISFPDDEDPKKYYVSYPEDEDPKIGCILPRGRGPKNNKGENVAILGYRWQQLLEESYNGPSGGELGTKITHDPLGPTIRADTQVKARTFILLITQN